MLDESQKALLYAKYGLDQPIVIQFFRYVFNMLKGDFGVSYTISKNTPISQLIAMRLPVSLKIGGQAILIGTLIGLAFGIITAIQSNDYNVIIALSFIYSAMYIAIMLVVDILYGFVDPKDCSSVWSDHQYGWCGNHDYRHGACSGEYGGSSG